MLDIDTRRRIDSARDILVGKVPDPKAQVEQITTALVYKFMDDMDKESIELGGKAQFFKNGYAHYAWSKLMDSRLGGHERLALYGEAITKMAENPNIPQLFRNIFKDAFLPYRDPETLNLFLKEINGFVYDHSERLGDAYEYLLSVLGSQGDAGQFRTPRHIIDFIVKVVDPDKTETILDPACGTAGFLISAFKHILGKYQKNKPGDMLSPAERKKFLGNFAGYDISPDMVRIALVNMYLHSFPDPSIVEYDTLTSEEKWDELYDCVLANPPFMTPKGGIRPHKRFSVQATRSEVLFVDYIMEHLTKDGRAGVIVPEGIIFQSQTAHKELRRKLVEENYLYAVVSLPTGVFNPYSGVKTSILLLDKNISKTKQDILFLTIDSDGYDLGAQRREIEKNDLPEAIAIVKDFVAGKKHHTSFSQLVKKCDILKNGDISLSGSRYQNEIKAISNHKLVKLGEYAKIIMGQSPDGNSYNTEGNGIPLINGPVEFGPTSFSNTIASKFTTQPTKLCKKGDIIICVRGSTTGRMNIAGFDGCIGRGVAAISSAYNEYLMFVLDSLRDKIYSLGTGSTFPNINFNSLANIQIPLPPLEIQQQIVAELSQYQKVIDGARMVVENYRPYIKVEKNWPLKKLADICNINESTIDPAKKFKNSVFTYIDISSVENGTGQISFSNRIEGNTAPSRARRVINTGDILLSTVRPNLKAFAYLRDCPSDAIASTGFAVLSPKKMVNAEYLFFLLFSEHLQSQMISRMGKGAYPSINQTDVENLEVPLPDLATQEQIAKTLNYEAKALEYNRTLTNSHQNKINTKLAEIWGKPS